MNKAWQLFSKKMKASVRIDYRAMRKNNFFMITVMFRLVVYFFIIIQNIQISVSKKYLFCRAALIGPMEHVFNQHGPQAPLRGDT